jgi:hypothetical protein
MLRISGSHHLPGSRAHRPVVLAVSVTLALVPALAFASAASATDGIYWATSGIRVANLNGSGSAADLFAAESNPFGVAIDPAGGKIYWANSITGSGAIRVANLDGSGTPTTLYPNEDQPHGVAIDPAAGKIYWADYANGQIRAGDLDGSGTPQTLYTDGGKVGGVAVDPAAGKIYWAQYNSFPPSRIRVGSLGGSSVAAAATLFDTTNDPSMVRPDGVAIDPDAGTIYWTDYASGGAGSARVVAGNLDGSGSVTNLYTGETQAQGVAIDPAAGKIYWGEALSGTGAIRVGSLAGSTVAPASSLDPNEDGPEYPALLKAPVGTGLPQVTGGGETGQELSCSTGSWAGDLLGAFLYRAPRTFSYKWLKDGSGVAGATSAAFTPAAAGSYACGVTASNQAGSTTQTSAAVQVTAPPNPPPPGSCPDVALSLAGTKHHSKRPHRIPAVQFKLSVSSPARVKLHARLRYREHGKHVVRLGHRSTNITGGARKLTIRLRRKLRRTLDPGQRVTVLLKVRAEPLGSGECPFQSAERLHLRSRVQTSP